MLHSALIWGCDMLKADEYKWRDREPLSPANLNNRVFDIDQRIHALEILTVNWQQVISQLENMGLSRINDLLTPLVAESKQLLASIKAEKAALRPADSVEYTYTSGLITEIKSQYADSIEIVTYQYNAMGLIESVMTRLGAQVRTEQYFYDQDGNVKRITTSINEVTT